MSGPQFFQTSMGMKFYEHTLPRIAAALEKLATQLDEKPAGPQIQSGASPQQQPAAQPAHNGVPHEMRVKRTVQEVLDQGCVADSMFRDIMREAMTRGLSSMSGPEIEDLHMLTEDEG